VPGQKPFTVPAEFAMERFASGGDAARRWLRAVPGLVHAAVSQWHLDLDGDELRHGAFAVVVPVRRAGEPCVLKVSQLVTAVAAEALALSAWDGRGAVRLLEAQPDQGILLLERLDPRRTLFDLPWPDAAEVAGGLLGRLASVPSPPGVPPLRQIAKTIAGSLPDRNRRAGGPVSRRYLDTAVGLALELGAAAGDRLVHADLHHGNVLAGRREPWLAVDPRAVAGDPEHAVPELLWTRLDELDGPADLRKLLDILVVTGELRSEMARDWSIVRCVDYWLWGLEHGMTEHPQRCRCIVEALTR
jgi:streptomycin 6-kinase